MARARPKVLTLTDAAAERVKAIMARSETPVAGLRVGVKKGGCAGMEYTMEYAAEVRPIDEVVEDKGVRILIEPSAILFHNRPYCVLPLLGRVFKSRFACRVPPPVRRESGKILWRWPRCAASA